MTHRFAGGAPKPANFDALVDAWNNPEAFARELEAYYAQVAADQAPPALLDITEPRRKPGESR